MRSSIQKIHALGVMTGDATSIHTIKLWEDAVAGIERPVTDAEALVLLNALPHEQSSCFGLAWTLLHAIETAPGYGAGMVEQSGAVGQWRATLLDRLSNAGQVA